MHLLQLAGFFDELQKLASKPPVSGVPSTASEARKTMSLSVNEDAIPEGPKLNVTTQAGKPGKMKATAKVRINAPELASPRIGQKIREMAPPKVHV